MGWSCEILVQAELCNDFVGLISKPRLDFTGQMKSKGTKLCVGGPYNRM